MSTIPEKSTKSRIKIILFDGDEERKIRQRHNTSLINRPMHCTDIVDSVDWQYGQTALIIVLFTWKKKQKQKQLQQPNKRHQFSNSCSNFIVLPTFHRFLFTSKKIKSSRQTPDTYWTLLIFTVLEYCSNLNVGSGVG